MLNLIPVVFRPDFRVLPLCGPGQKFLPSTAQLEDAAKAKRDDPLHSCFSNALTAKVSKRSRAIVDENHSSSIAKRPKTDVNDRTTGKWWGATSMPPGWRCEQCTTRQPSMETIKCVSCMAPRFSSVSTITPLFQGSQTTGTSTLSSATGGATSNFGAGAITDAGFVFGGTILQAAPSNAQLTVSKRRKVRAKRPHKGPTGPPRRNPPRASRK